MTLSDWINDIRWKYFTNEKAGLIFKELMKEFQMVNKMTENKRYTTDNGSNEDVCLVDNVTGKQLEVVDITEIDVLLDLLNEQDVRIKELESENKMLKTTISRNEAYIKRVTTKGKWSNTGDVE